MRSRQSDVGLYDAVPGPDRQREAFRSGEVPVAVYGLGKMGLPLAGVYADVAGNVAGVDVDESVAAAVDAGECHVTGEPGLPALIERTVANGSLSATADAESAAAAARVHVIIVPTLLTADDEPDLAMLRAATESVGAGLAPGDLVIVESTVPPGTCRDVVAPLLGTESGLDEGAFGVAFCPERTSSGRALRDIRGAYPKVVGGVDDESTRAAALIYDEITDNDVVTTSDATTAECVKVFEGVYRDVNIALANELARVADDLAVDVPEAVDVANTQPYCDIHEPGPGVGGHCIPVYPHFLTSRVRPEMPLVRTARAVNDGMASFAADKLHALLSERGVAINDASVLLLGATYRAGVAEVRHAPARRVAGELSEVGADVTVTDPLVEGAAVADWPGTFRRPDDVDPEEFDGVVLVTAHDEFRERDWTWHDHAVVDTRRVLDPDEVGGDLHAVGRGNPA